MSFQRNSLSALAVLLAVVLSGCAKPDEKPAAKRTADETPAATTDATETPRETPPEEVETVIEETLTEEESPGEPPEEPVAPEEPATDEPVDEEPATEAEPPIEEPKVEDAAPPAKEEPQREKIMLGEASLTAGIPGEGPLTIEEITTWLEDEKNHVPLEPELPLGLNAGATEIKIPANNPMTRAKIELGRQLYFDPRLSGDSTISCATCHAPTHGFAAPTQFGVGIGDQVGNRNSPTAYNRILSGPQFWDGRAESLEEQAKGPIANPIEMGNEHEVCVSTITNNEGYKLQFAKVFPGQEIDIEAIAKAIATFERAIVTHPSPFDYNEQLKPFEQFEDEDIAELQEDDPATFARYQELLESAAANPMSDRAKRGRELFFGQKANCTACHVGANLTDEKYHNIGVGMDQEKPDLGRFVVTNKEEDKGAFKTPTIRNVATTPPYMHDGSQGTLMEVVEWYAKGGHPNEWLSKDIKKLDLTQQDKEDLVAFMEACTGEFPVVESGRLPE